MKVASCFAYVLSTLLYLSYATNNVAWDIMGMMTMLLFICVLGYFAIDNKPNKTIDKIFLHYSIYMTIGRVVYTCYCLLIDDTVIVYNTDVFNMITCTTFAILTVHCAIYHKRYTL